MLVNAFDQHCDSGLYTLRFHLFDHMVKDIHIFGTLYVSDSIPYKHFNVHIKQAYKRISQRRQIRVMEMVGVMGRNGENIR